MAKAGPPESTGAEGGEISCANPDISEDNRRIVRPPAPLISGGDVLLESAAASGMVLIGALRTAADPVAVADNGATLMVARGMAASTLLFGDDNFLD